MRSAAGLRPETEEEQIDAAERLQLLNVASQLVLQVGNICAHRREAFDLLKECVAEQALKITNKVQRVLHAQRSQCILGENVKPSQQRIQRGGTRHFGDQAIHRLRPPATQQNNDQVSGLRSGGLLNLFQLRSTYFCFGLNYFRLNRILIEADG